MTERTLKEWLPLIGETVLCRFDNEKRDSPLWIAVKILDVKGGASSLSLLVTPLKGSGEQWVGYKRLIIPNEE